jgi:hypothetical protein
MKIEPGKSVGQIQIGADQKAQADLISQGKFLDAIQTDIDDIRSKFGSKYDEHIHEMLNAFGF